MCNNCIRQSTILNILLYASKVCLGQNIKPEVLLSHSDTKLLFIERLHLEFHSVSDTVALLLLPQLSALQAK